MRTTVEYGWAKKAAVDAALSLDEATEALGALIDGAGAARNEADLELAIDWAARLDDGSLSNQRRALLHYYLSNAWAHLDEIRSPGHTTWARPELEREILHLRTASRLAHASGTPILRRCQMLTNLGNALRWCGRLVEAIACYDAALALDPTFDMARGNRGASLEEYSRLTHEPVHQSLIAREAHSEIVRALRGDKLHLGARESFAKSRGRIEQHFPREYLDATPHEHDERLGRTKRERAYRLWCLRERLVLNPLNELGPRPVGARDSLTLPAMIEPIGHGPKYHGFFNQLKQEYATARYFAYEGAHTVRPHFSDRHVDMTDLYDYAAYGIGVEKIRVAYRMAYSILDKIAVLTNEYFKAGWPAGKAEFRWVWYEKQKVGAPLRSALHRPENAGLRALFWLSKDLYDRGTPYAEATEPEAAEAAEIRNHLEHRYVKLHTEFSGQPRRPTYAADKYAAEMPTAADESFEVLRRDRLALSIGRGDFVRRTLWTLRTARTALLYSVFAVRIHEAAREATHPSPERVLTTTLRSVPDNRKV